MNFYWMLNSIGIIVWLLERNIARDDLDVMITVEYNSLYFCNTYLHAS